MKFAITITDATPAELIGLAHYLNGNPAMVISGATIAAGPITAGPVGGTAQADDEGGDNANAPHADSTGLPWDARIHAKTKALNKDGTWRERRGVDKATVDQVTKELQAAQNGGQRPAPMFDQGTVLPQQQTLPPAQPPFPPSFGMPMPAPAAMPPQPTFQQPQPPVQHQQPAPQAMDFGAFMAHLTGQMQKRDGNGAPIIEATYLLQVCSELSQRFNRQISTITDIAGQPDAINAAVEIMTTHGRWQFGF